MIFNNCKYVNSNLGRVSVFRICGRVSALCRGRYPTHANATQLASLQGSAAELTGHITARSEDLIQIQQLQEDVESTRLLYRTFFARQQKASVQQGLKRADARGLSPGVPRGASSSRVLVASALAALLGRMVGAMIVFVREWRFASFRTTDEGPANIGALVLGSLPDMSRHRRKDVSQSLKDTPNLVFSEAVRNLHTAILMFNPGREPQVILVSASIPVERKTTMDLAPARHFKSLEGSCA